MANVIKEYKLILTEVGTNNNKYWYGYLYDDGTAASEYGRVGYNPQKCNYPNHSVLERKVREKFAKGYTELKVIGGSVTASGGGTTVGKGDLHEIAKSQIVKTSNNPTLDRLIKRFVDANVHKITSSTQITYNASSGLFATPLGIITQEAIDDARDLLANIAKFVRGNDYSEQLNQNVSKYLRLVPQNIGMKLNVRNLFPDDNAVQKQNDLLDSLESSYKASTTAPAKPSAKGDKPLEQVFKVDLDVLNDDKERRRLEKWYETSKKKMHGYDNVKIREIFMVKIHEMDNGFDNKLGNITEVFHGTSQANCLSILKSGLKVSPPSTAAIAGKMFGNGIYGAINSSKSLGYTFNRWGQGGVGDAGWLFICDFAMGKIYSTGYSCGKPSGYDSIWAKAGNGLYHDELIVYRNPQVNIKYLLECK